MKTHSALNWFLLICLGVIWGGSFLGVKLALVDFGPMTVAALRLLIAAVVLFTMALATGHGLPRLSAPRGRRIWLHCIGMGIFTNALPFTLLNWGQLYVTSGFAGISMAVVPLLVLPLAHFLVPGERIGAQKTLGFLVGFAGTIVLIGPGAILSAGGGALEPLARIACVTAACCYAIGSIITRLCPPVSMISYSAAGLLVGAAIMVPAAISIEGLPDWPDTWWALFGVVYLGLMPTALATLLLVRLINTSGPSFLSLVNYQVPVWAVVFGVVALGEPIPSQFLGALGLILAGLAISQAQIKRLRAG